MLERTVRYVFSAWCAAWLVSYGLFFGPQFLLWFCCIANLYLLVGLWRRSALWFSLAAISVLPIQLLYIAELVTRIALGVRLHGATDYVFDASIPLAIRALSSFHVFAPALMLYGLRRFGYDRRAFGLQNVLATGVLCASYFWFDPETQTNDAIMPTVAGVPFDRDFNLNWVHGFHDAPAPDGRELEVLLCLLAGYPLCVHWPMHRLLSWRCA